MFFSISAVFRRDKFCPCVDIKGININTNPAMISMKIKSVAIVAKVCLNFNLFLKKSSIGFPIKVRIKATTR